MNHYKLMKYGKILNLDGEDLMNLARELAITHFKTKATRPNPLIDEIMSEFMVSFIKEHNRSSFLTYRRSKQIFDNCRHRIMYRDKQWKEQTSAYELNITTDLASTYIGDLDLDFITRKLKKSPKFWKYFSDVESVKFLCEHLLREFEFTPVNYQDEKDRKFITLKNNCCFCSKRNCLWVCNELRGKHNWFYYRCGKAKISKDGVRNLFCDLMQKEEKFVRLEILRQIEYGKLAV